MGWRPLPFYLQGVFLHMCSWEGLLDFKNEEYVVFYLLPRQGSTPLSCYFGVSVHRGETVQPGGHLSPASTWAQKNQNSPKGFSKAFLKTRRERGCHGVCDQLMNNSLIGWCWANMAVNLINPSVPEGLGAMCSRSSSILVNFFHLVLVLASEKLRKYASDTITWQLQRGAKTEGMGGICPGKAP